MLTQEIEVGEIKVTQEYVPFSAFAGVKNIIANYTKKCFEIDEEIEVPKDIKKKDTEDFINAVRADRIMENIAALDEKYAEDLIQSLSACLKTIGEVEATPENVDMLLRVTSPLDKLKFLNSVLSFDIDDEDKKKLFTVS